MSTRCIFSLLVLHFHALSCPSVLLKYAHARCGVFPGGTYQLPQRWFATRGRGLEARPRREGEDAARRTNWASEWMEVRRLWMLRVERLREERRLEREGRVSSSGGKEAMVVVVLVW